MPESLTHVVSTRRVYVLIIRAGVVHGAGAYVAGSDVVAVALDGREDDRRVVEALSEIPRVPPLARQATKKKS
jgi:hypothetical protein